MSNEKAKMYSLKSNTLVPSADKGFSFRPTLVWIEAHPEVRQQILDYFTLRGHVLVGKYLRADTQNLYFTPLLVPGD